MWSARYHVTKETSRFILSTGLGSWRASSDSCTNAATFRKDRRLNIRLSSKDLEAIQKRALAEGLPYQTLISSLLHKYASGRLKDVLTRVSTSNAAAATFLS